MPPDWGLVAADLWVAISPEQFALESCSSCPRSAKHVALKFHPGASLPDPTGLLNRMASSASTKRATESGLSW